MIIPYGACSHSSTAQLKPFHKDGIPYTGIFQYQRCSVGSEHVRLTNQLVSIIAMPSIGLVEMQIIARLEY